MTAPTPARRYGQSPPTAGTALATATPSCPVREQWAAIEKVLSSLMTHTARWSMTRACASGARAEPLSTISPSFSTA